MAQEGGLLDNILYVVLAIILITGVVIATIHDTNTADWSVSEIAIWSVAGIGAVAAVVRLIFRMAG